MNSKRMYFVMLGVIGLLFIGLFAGTYGINNLLQSHSKQLSDVKAKSESLANQQQGLVKAKKQVAQYSDLEKIAQTIVPQDKDQAEAVREIASLAAASGIPQLSSITFPASTLGAHSSGAVSSGSTAPATPSASSSKSNLTQLVPVPGVQGVYQLQITITQTNQSKVTYNQFYTFLSKLEQNRRTAQVSSVTLQPDPTNPNYVAFVLIVNEFIKP
ncbi:MAG TPA: hypothetical protein VFH39_01210 [Candidatus Saccharimonadales bacterium]|nr:hypothetical protein [Candidatus Saccharimonadales bacterium]